MTRYNKRNREIKRERETTKEKYREREREREYSVVVVVVLERNEVEEKKLDVTVRYGTVPAASGTKGRGLATIHGVTVRIQPGQACDWRRGCSRARG